MASRIEQAIGTDYLEYEARDHSNPQFGHVLGDYSSAPKSGAADWLEAALRLRRNENLLHAAKDGSLTLLKQSLDEGAEINHSDDIGLTALHYAVIGSSLPAAKALMQAGCDVNAASFRVGTALHLAALRLQLALVKLLIPHSDLESTGSLVGTVLHCAAMSRPGQAYGQADIKRQIYEMLLSARPGLAGMQCEAVPGLIELMKVRYLGTELKPYFMNSSFLRSPLHTVYKCLPLHLALISKEETGLSLLLQARPISAMEVCSRRITDSLNDTSSAPVSGSQETTNITPLMLAAATGHPRAVYDLRTYIGSHFLEAIEAQDSDGKNALGYAPWPFPHLGALSARRQNSGELEYMQTQEIRELLDKAYHANLRRRSFAGRLNFRFTRMFSSKRTAKTNKSIRSRSRGLYTLD